MEALTEIRLIDFTDAGYAAMTELQRTTERKTLYDGKARWIIPMNALYVRAAADDYCVAVAVKFSSDDPTADLSWGAAKAYIYALYHGAAEGIKKNARREGTRRFVGMDEQASVDAQVGAMHIEVTVTVTSPS